MMSPEAPPTIFRMQRLSFLPKLTRHVEKQDQEAIDIRNRPVDVPDILLLFKVNVISIFKK